MNKNKKFVFNDFVVQYNECNFSCDYCLNKLKPDETEIWKSTNQFGVPSYSETKIYDYEYVGELKSRIDTTINNFREAIDAPILRISGGEILGMKNVKELLSNVCKEYEIVQIVTNGFFLESDMVEYLRDLGNIHIHFSIDGHTQELNYYRVKNKIIHDKLLKNLETCVINDIPIEISSVLTNRNTKEYESFVQYLMRYRGRKLKVFPAPVRGEHAKHLFPNSDDIDEFETILQRYEQYREILPPKPYMLNLVRFLKLGRKETQCFIPVAAIQSLDNGALTACPNGWTSQIANVCFDTAEDVVNNIKTNKIYTVMTQKRPRLMYCKECYTAYEVINLFFSNSITEAELRTIPLYNNANVFERIKEVKKCGRKNYRC